MAVSLCFICELSSLFLKDDIGWQGLSLVGDQYTISVENVGQKLCCSANVAFAAFLHFLCVSIAGKIGHFCSPMFHGFCANKPFFQTLNSIFAGNDFLLAKFFAGNVFLLEMFFCRSCLCWQ